MISQRRDKEKKRLYVFKLSKTAQGFKPFCFWGKCAVFRSVSIGLGCCTMTSIFGIKLRSVQIQNPTQPKEQRSSKFPHLETQMFNLFVYFFLQLECEPLNLTELMILNSFHSTQLGIILKKQSR